MQKDNTTNGLPESVAHAISEYREAYEQVGYASTMKTEIRDKLTVQHKKEGTPAAEINTWVRYDDEVIAAEHQVTQRYGALREAELRLWAAFGLAGIDPPPSLFRGSATRRHAPDPTAVEVGRRTKAESKKEARRVERKAKLTRLHDVAVEVLREHGPLSQTQLTHACAARGCRHKTEFYREAFEGFANDPDSPIKLTIGPLAGRTNVRLYRVED
jgi:hypothetical protein